MNTPLVNIDIAPSERQLVVTLLELDAPWTSVAPIERVLSAIERLGLDLVRASVDLDATWVPYDRAAAAAAVWSGVGVHNRTAVALASADGTRRATVARYDRTPESGPPTHRNTVTLTLPATEVVARGLEGVEAAIAEGVAALPSFTLGTASAAHVVHFPSLLDEPQPPVPLEQTAWLHVIGARALPGLGGAERLLATPVRVAQREDGTVWLWSYDDPMRYDTAAAIDGMRALSRHLRVTSGLGHDRGPAGAPDAPVEPAMTFVRIHAEWPGRLGAAELGPALDATVDNAWSSLVEMCADTTEQGRLDWSRYDRQRALEIVTGGRALFLRESAATNAVEAQIWCHSNNTSVILYVPDVADARLRAHLARVVAALPDGAYGSVLPVAS